MTARLNNAFRPSIENLEDRQLLTVSLGAALPVLHANPLVATPSFTQQLSNPLSVDYGNTLATPSRTALKAAAPSSSVTSYSAVSIVNNTHFNLTFSIRWNTERTVGSGGAWTSWQTFTLPPGYRGEYYVNVVDSDPLTLWGPPVSLGETAQIYFSTSTAAGHTQTYNLSSGVVNGVPSIGAGTHYEFLPTSSSTLNLYTGG